MKWCVLRRSNCVDSVLTVDPQFLLDMRELSDLADGMLSSPYPELWAKAEGEDGHFIEDMNGGLYAMRRIAKSLPGRPVHVKFREAFFALRVCFYLSDQVRLLSPRLLSNLREIMSILAECNYVYVRGVRCLPFRELDPILREMPVVKKHYVELEAISAVEAGLYVMTLSDARDLIRAFKGKVSEKTWVLLNQLETLTEEVRTAFNKIERPEV